MPRGYRVRAHEYGYQEPQGYGEVGYEPGHYAAAGEGGYAPSSLLDDAATGTGNVGRTAELRPGRSETLIQLNADDWTAQQMTVCIAPPEPVSTGELVADSEVTAGAHVVAVVTWGIGGLQMSAEVDCARGAVLSVPASSLVVTVRHALPVEAGPIYRVGAFVGYAPRPGSNSPRRTLYGATTDGAAWSALVPAFASSVSPLRVEGAVPMTVAFLGLAAERLAEVVLGETEQPTEIPIPNGAVRVSIASVRPSAFALSFGLAL